MPTRTESDAGRIVLTQQARLPRHSTGLDCSESGFSYQTLLHVYGTFPYGLWLYISILEQCHIQHVLYYVYVNFPHDCGSMTHATCVCTCVPEGSSLEGLLTVGPIDGRESGGGWLSTTRGLLEANFFAAVADIGECNISTTSTI